MNSIEILEELINGAKEFNQYDGNKYYKAIENLIKENKDLKNKCNELNFKYTAQWVDDNFIPKSKVKEKIEELKKEFDKEDIYEILTEEAKNLLIRIEVLQELLEEGE